MDEGNGNNELAIDHLRKAASSLGLIIRRVDAVAEKPSRDHIDDIWWDLLAVREELEAFLEGREPILPEC